jgi:hypothetical protein
MIKVAMGRAASIGGHEMTKPGAEKKRLDQRSDEEIELSKETLEDLDAEEEASDVKGGQTNTCGQRGCQAQAWSDTCNASV